MAAGTLVHQGALQSTDPATLGLAAAAAIMAFGLDVLRRRLCDGIGWRHVADVRAALFSHVLHAEPAFVARRRHGALLQVFLGDLSAQRLWWSDGMPRAFTAPILLATMLCWAFLQSPTLAAWIGGLTTIGILAGLLLLRPLGRAVRQVRRARGRVATFASERLAAAATIHAFGRQGAELVRLERRAVGLHTAALRRSWLVGALRGLPHLVTSLIVMAVLVSGAHVSGTLIVLGTAGLALTDLARAAELWIPAIVSARRIDHLMAAPLPPRRRMSRKPTTRSSGLSLQNVELPGMETSLTARAVAGDVVQLVGDPSRVSGLLELIAGMAPPTAGRIRWDGMDPARMRISTRRDEIGLVLPELPLLAGSNRLNIRYGAPFQTEERLASLWTTWGIDPAASTDPEAAHSVALLRALAAAPRLLILDLGGLRLDSAMAAHLRTAIAAHEGVVVIGNAPDGIAPPQRLIWTVGAAPQPKAQGASCSSLQMPAPLGERP